MEQLLGTYPSDDSTRQAPSSRVGDKDLYPCGVIANSMFNDVITLENEDITMRENNLAWASTTTRSSRSPRILNGRTTTADISGCLGVISDYDALARRRAPSPRRTPCLESVCQADPGSSTCAASGRVSGRRLRRRPLRQRYQSTVYYYKDEAKYQYPYAQTSAGYCFASSG